MVRDAALIAFVVECFLWFVEAKYTGRKRHQRGKEETGVSKKSELPSSFSIYNSNIPGSLASQSLRDSERNSASNYSLDGNALVAGSGIPEDFIQESNATFLHLPNSDEQESNAESESETDLGVDAVEHLRAALRAGNGTQLDPDATSLRSLEYHEVERMPSYPPAPSTGIFNLRKGTLGRSKKKKKRAAVMAAAAMAAGGIGAPTADDDASVLSSNSDFNNASDDKVQVQEHDLNAEELHLIHGATAASKKIKELALPAAQKVPASTVSSSIQPSL